MQKIGALFILPGLACSGVIKFAVSVRVFVKIFGACC